MRMTVIAVALVALIAAPAAALDWPDLTPDAGLLAHTGAGDTIDGAAWNVATVGGHRLWADLLDPRGTWGIGASADVTPGGAACFGGGYRDGWLIYYGVHF